MDHKSQFSSSSMKCNHVSVFCVQNHVNLSIKVGKCSANIFVVMVFSRTKTDQQKLDSLPYPCRIGYMCGVWNFCQGKRFKMQTICFSNMQRNLGYIAQSMYDIVIEVQNAAVTLTSCRWLSIKSVKTVKVSSLNLNCVNRDVKALLNFSLKDALFIQGSVFVISKKDLP